MGFEKWTKRFERFATNNSLRAKPETHLASGDLFGGVFPVKHSLELGESILAGNLKVIQWLDGLEYGEIDGFDWNVDHTDSPTSFQLFLQGLNPVLYLVGAFVLTGNADYYHLALDFYESWSRFAKSRLSKGNEYVWDQHAAALRAENLLSLLIVGIERGLLSKKQERSLICMLQKHANYHLDAKNYLPGENHGLFQDRALLYMGYAFDRHDWVDIAVGRIREQWDSLFDEEMACAENSFTYQRVDKNLFIDVSDIMRKKGNPVGEELHRKISGAEDFMGFALMPNSMCPPFGDTFRSDYYLCDSVDEKGVLAFSASRGAKGIMPSSTRKVYHVAGYYFGRQFWDDPEGKKPFEDSVWTMFRSGYTSITHRQADDNSFMFYAFGKEVFTDAGAYNYMYRDPIRRYVRSSLAHNSIFVDGKSYDFLQRDNTDLAGFCHCELGKDDAVDYIVGFNSLYRGVVWFRHFVFFSEGVFLLDELFSKSMHEYSQVFHCGPEIEEVEKAGLDVKVLTGGIDQRYVALSQLGTTEGLVLEVHQGSESSLSEDVPFGIIGGSDLNEMEYVKTLEYKQCGKATTYATAILACESDDAKRVVAFDSASRELSLCVKGRKTSFNLQSFDPKDYSPASKFDFDDFVVERERSVFRFQYAADRLGDLELAWYVMGNHGRRPVFKSPYRKDGRFEFDFEGTDDPDCAIRVFARDPVTGEMGSQIICGIRRDADADEWHAEYWPDWDSDWHQWFDGTEVLLCSIR